MLCTRVAALAAALLPIFPTVRAETPPPQETAPPAGTAPAASATRNAAPATGGGQVNFDFFYSSLKEDGSWLDSADYGYVWQPKVAVDKPDWRPYTDGSWSRTGQGWTWVSNENFGWATYHYGRWTRLETTGWAWVPGYEWAPAWVAWRSSPKYAERNTARRPVSRPVSRGVRVTETDEYIGWAPLPPEAVFDYSTGFGPGVDAYYDIGPSNYSFVSVAYFGAPSLYAVVRPAYDNFGYFGSTVGATNLSYVGGGSYIYAGGPSYELLSPVLINPIPILALSARPATFYSGAALTSAALANQVQGNQLLVSAPAVTRPAGIAPGTVGLPKVAGVAAPARARAVAAEGVQRGWQGSKLDPAQVDQIHAHSRAAALIAPQRAIAPSRPIAPAQATIPLQASRGAAGAALTAAAAQPFAARMRTPDQARSETARAVQQARVNPAARGTIQPGIPPQANASDRARAVAPTGGETPRNARGTTQPVIPPQAGASAPGNARGAIQPGIPPQANASERARAVAPSGSATPRDGRQSGSTKATSARTPREDRAAATRSSPPARASAPRQERVSAPRQERAPAPRQERAAAPRQERASTPRQERAAAPRPAPQARANSPRPVATAKAAGSESPRSAPSKAKAAPAPKEKGDKGKE